MKHIYSIAFTVDTPNIAEHVDHKEILAALMTRVAEITLSAGDCLEAVGEPLDTYED